MKQLIKHYLVHPVRKAVLLLAVCLAVLAPLAAYADHTNSWLVSQAYSVLEAIRDADYAALAAAAHPDRGVTFSPYACADPALDVCLSPGQLTHLASDETAYVWGAYDGEGSPISLTPAAYFARFVYDVDFAAASVLGIDTVIAYGNAVETVRDVYPGARFVEFYVPGVDEAMEGMDWRSLKLVFEPYGDGFALVAVIHNEWTT